MMSVRNLEGSEWEEAVYEKLGVPSRRGRKLPGGKECVLYSWVMEALRVKGADLGQVRQGTIRIGLIPDLMVIF